ncbi:hypothetical protein [Aquimarina aggregata]|uniref:hypothetical protein n=1 Tax=Aquimarina aggregata TaxID=1642818 RepID=UPI002493C40A|nr:hypothetical protein [Aquimarina aggregata]
MQTVSKIGYVVHPTATMGRTIQLTIDRQPLLDILEGYIEEENLWIEKKDAKINIVALLGSMEETGDYEIITCTHCDFPEDIYMSSFKVVHESDYILWHIAPPYTQMYPEQKLIAFKFHKEQYVNALLAIKDENER